MTSAWDIISSSFVLVLFLGVVYAVIRSSRAVAKSSDSTRKSLQSKGVTYADGKLSVKTDRAPPSRDEYIQQTQRAFEAGARTLSNHPDAFRMGPAESAQASASATDDKKGFRRTKKLD